MMKVFQYSQTASFAFRWPDCDGTIRPFLNRRPCLDYEKLDILCLDPDTLEATYMGGGQQALQDLTDGAAALEEHRQTQISFLLRALRKRQVSKMHRYSQTSRAQVHNPI